MKSSSLLCLPLIFNFIQQIFFFFLGGVDTKRYFVEKNKVWCNLKVEKFNSKFEAQDYL